MLGLSPTHSHRRGERRRPDGPQFSTGAWLHRVESDVAPDAPDRALGSLLDSLPSDRSLWIGITQRYEVRIFFRIGFEGWNKGFTLSAHNIQRTADLGVRLDFDLYASENSRRRSTNGCRDRGICPRHTGGCFTAPATTSPEHDRVGAADLRQSETYCGAIRIAPSRRMTSPLSIGLSMMWSTSAAYSSGVPRRWGRGCWRRGLLDAFRQAEEHRRLEDPGGDRHHADAVAGEFARRRQRQRRDARP